MYNCQHSLGVAALGYADVDDQDRATSFGDGRTKCVRDLLSSGYDRLIRVIDEFAKAHLHDHLRWVREALVWKLDGLSEYDIRRPVTMTGTNLLGLVKHNAIWDSRYFGEVFGRPFAEPLPRWDDRITRGADHWAAEGETREDIVGLYRRVWDHVDATIVALAIDSPGFVPWWNEDVQLFNVMVHRLSDATRHAGHADILREQLDGAVGGDSSDLPFHGRDVQFWNARSAELERIARASGRPSSQSGQTGFS